MKLVRSIHQMFSSHAHLLQHSHCFLRLPGGCSLLLHDQGVLPFQCAWCSFPWSCSLHLPASHCLSHAPVLPSAFLGQWRLGSPSWGVQPAFEQAVFLAAHQAQQGWKSLFLCLMFPLVTYQGLAGKAQHACGPWLIGTGKADEHPRGCSSQERGCLSPSHGQCHAG